MSDTFKITIELPKVFDFGGSFKDDNGLVLYNPGTKPIYGWAPEMYAKCALHGMKQRCRDAVTQAKNDKVQARHGGYRDAVKACFVRAYDALAKGEWDSRGPRLDAFALELRDALKVNAGKPSEKRIKAFQGLKDEATDALIKGIAWSGDRASVIESVTKVIGAPACKKMVGNVDVILAKREDTGELAGL